MIVTLETAIPCACGCRVRAVMVATVRVNKRSLRTTGPRLGFIEHTHCPECGAEVPRGEMEREPYRLVPEDAVKVAAYRKRKWGVEDGGVAVDRVRPETAATGERAAADARS